MHKNQPDIFKLSPHGLSFVLFLGGFMVFCIFQSGFDITGSFKDSSLMMSELWTFSLI